MLIDIVESADQNLVYLLGDLSSVVFYITHLGHNSLEFLLDDMLFFRERNILSDGVSACIRVGVLDAQYFFVERVAISGLLHVTHHDAL